MAWLSTVLEIQFAGAMVVLAADIAKSKLGSRRPLVIGGIAAAFLLLSLVELIASWGPISIQPLASIFASIYSVDKLGNLVILTVLLAGFAVTIFTAFTLTRTDNIGTFYALLMLLVSCSIGVVSAGDFLTLFLFWEGLSIVAYGLVSFERRDISLEAAMKYFFLAGAGSLVYLLGVALVYSSVGSIRLADLPLLLASNGPMGVVALLMILVGIGVEVAIFPVHTWLPDAYGAAPAQIGALNGRVVDETLLFAMLKVIQPFVVQGSVVQGIQVTLVTLAILTMLVGNFGALGQGNLRRMLAFSSIAQMGYMLAALSTFSVLGLIAVTFQIWNHGLVKANFFMLTGVGGRKEFEDADFEKLKGAGRQNRPLGVLFTASSLAMVGSPPFGMFWSEILIVQSLLLASTPLFTWVALVVVANIVLSIVYYYRVINTVVFSESAGPVTNRPSRDMLPSTFLLALSVISGLIPALILGLIV
ncbi:MAG: proton-conducting transporter membrane subunit [Nitrososphaerales archaeon]|jgi:proton-translocating NADH-quinone oxidoreductase chain N